MTAFLGLSRFIDSMNEWIGRLVAWCIVVAVGVSAINAIIRKVFGTSSNAWLELQWYLFGAVFMLCAAWTLKANEHIRIDIVSARLSRRTRSWIDVIGHVFFLGSFCAVLIYTSIPFVRSSIASGEISTNAGGLIIWPSKILILIGFILLAIQGLSELIKRVAIMQGHLPDTSGGGHLSAAEAEAERLLTTQADIPGELPAVGPGPAGHDAPDRRP